MSFSKIFKLSLAALGAATISATHAQGQTQNPPTLTVNTITAGRLYWIGGGGGNSGVLIGRDGVVVIDAKTTPAAARAMIAEIAKLTPKPITHVIVTHSDGDHVNGLPGFPAGVKIIAHVNAKFELLAVPIYAAVEIDGGRCLPPADHLPNSLVFGSGATAVIAGERLRFHHFGPAHTNGDLVVEIPSESIAFTGDLITSTVLVHPEKTGSLEGWFTNAEALLRLPVNHYVGGHATTMDTKGSLRTRMAGYQVTRDKVDALIGQGRTLPEIKVVMGDPPKDPSGCRGIPYPSLAWIQYHERTSRDQQIK